MTPIQQATVAEADVRSGKGAGDENFPVASRLIAPRHRPVIMAFYAFARTADDVADHEALSPGEKLERLETLRGALLGEHDRAPVAVNLRHVLAAHGLPTRHADTADLVVVDAFERARLAGGMATMECTADIARILRPPGIYLANVSDGAGLPFARRFLL